METILILHNIRSAENVGSIFRTADSAGAKAVYLTGYTPTPIDRFGRKSSKIAKSALGAEDFVSWKSMPDIKNLIEKLKADGFYVVAVEQDKRSTSYKKYKLKNKTAFVFGNEVDGLDEGVLSLVDEVVEIPMKGRKESLNVAVSAGIVLFNFVD